MDSIENTSSGDGKEMPANISMNEFVSYEESFKTIEPGQYLRGRVVKVDKDGIFVDVGHKTEGLIPPHEITQLEAAGGDSALKEGDEIDIVVIKVTDEGDLILSKKRADLEFAWKNVIKAFETGEVLSATCIEQVKGGLIVDIGLRGFVPASHVDVRPVRDLSEFVGEALRLKVLELDRARRKVVLSRKKVLEEEREHSREATLKSLYEGEIRIGKVARITNFGAFVNLGGVDGLIHISEISWRRIRHPSEVVKVGDEVEVLVLKVDKEKERISLSLRQAKPDPWLSVKERFSVGNIVEGKVSKLAKNYVFTELAEGIEGLIPIVELADEKMVKPEDILKVNQTIQVKILDIRPQERRIILSLRQAMQDAVKEEYQEYISSRSKNFTVGDLLKSKMEAKTLQDIISPKSAPEERKPPAITGKSPVSERPTIAVESPVANRLQVTKKPPIAPAVEKPPIAPTVEKPPIAPTVEKPPIAPTVEKPPIAPTVEKPILEEKNAQQNIFSRPVVSERSKANGVPTEQHLDKTSDEMKEAPFVEAKKEDTSEEVERLIQDVFLGKLDDERE